VEAKIPLEKLPKTLALIKKYEKNLGGDGRILVRYSGTENLLRVMAEGRVQKEIKSMAHNIISLAGEEISGKIK
jgi:phosphoglucosamine mutase